jgi:hypothetical protein
MVAALTDDEHVAASKRLRYAARRALSCLP